MPRKQKKTLLGVDPLEAGEEQLTINSEYASRHDHNKQREELHRLQEKYGLSGAQVMMRNSKAVAGKAFRNDGGEESEESSSSSDSDEDEDVLGQLQDPDFLSVLAKIRKRENLESLADAEAEEGEAEEQPRVKKRKREKPVLLKDVARDMDGESSEDEAEEEAAQPYTQELEGFRRNLIQAADEGAQEDGDLFGDAKRRSDGSGPLPAEANAHQDTNALLDQFFGKDEDLAEDDLFLKRFISKKGDTEGRAAAQQEEEWPDDDLEEDEQHIEAAEKFEADHNFRFEAPGAGIVKTYPRNVEGVVRQGDTKRSAGRALKKQRKQEERAKMEAEIQRLKTLKRQEIENRMSEIQASSGLSAAGKSLQELLDSEDFDETEYDRAMQQTFSEQYYAEGDDEAFGSDLDEPPEDADGLEGEEPGEGFRALKRRLGEGEPSQRDTQSVQKLLEEYHKLEYEDIVAGLPTRFRYAKVEEDDYGLSTNDIVSLSDKDLNQLVGLRKLAPYRDAGNVKKGRRDTIHRLKALKAATSQAEKEKANGKNGSVDEVVPKAKATSGEHRLSTYAKPQLNEAKPQLGSKAKLDKGKKEEKAQPSPAAPGFEGLTKAQKKNLKRSQKRAEKAT